ncbi:hypothetical protein PINS_up008664 [Pythium insidiosum]|nr:hypothetical protein PINS_up008664 [Pythium insidiosum]
MPKSPAAAPISSLPWKPAALVVALALWIHALNNFAPLDSYFPSALVDSTAEPHFSETYYQARALFRERAHAADATLHAIALPHLAHLDLTIDVAVIAGLLNALCFTCLERMASKGSQEVVSNARHLLDLQTRQRGRPTRQR